MPTFNAYPASQVRAPDVWGAMQRGAEGAQMNQLRQMKIQSGMSEVQRQGQLRGLMPGVGAEANLGPSSQKALALDPSQLATLMSIPRAERKRKKEAAKVLGDFGMAILNAPDVQRPALDAQMRQVAAEYDVGVSTIPPLGDPGYEAALTSNIIKAGQVAAMLEQAEQAEPSGYQRTEGGLEFTPGGPADPVQAERLATAKRGPDGGNRPAMLQVADAYKQAMKRAGKEVSDAQALRWAKSSVNDTPQKTWTKIYMANRRDIIMDEDQARKIADEITDYVHGKTFGETETTPTPAPGGASLSPVGTAKAAIPPARSPTEVTIPIPPENGAPAPRRKPAREKSIETMTKNEVVDLIYGGQELSQDEIDRLDTRLKALGF